MADKENLCVQIIGHVLKGNCLHSILFFSFPDMRNTGMVVWRDILMNDEHHNRNVLNVQLPCE